MTRNDKVLSSRCIRWTPPSIHRHPSSDSYLPWNPSESSAECVDLERSPWSAKVREHVLGDSALLQFIAKDLLCVGREVVDLVGEIADFDVAHFAVERGEAAPFFHGVLLHGEQYSGFRWRIAGFDSAGRRSTADSESFAPLTPSRKCADWGKLAALRMTRS